ncbi:HEPN domain-containing protein [Pontibacter qinzhouensis]|nr:HEPN domain-containing protein [Pontibacter qinzhouensis]
MPSSIYQEHHPNILEFWTDEHEKVTVPIEFEELQDSMDLTATSVTKQDKLLTLLSTFTNNLFFKYQPMSGTWGIPLPATEVGDEIDSVSSQWCMRLYHSPGMFKSFKENQFTAPTYEPIKRVAHRDYYTNNPNLDFKGDKRIELPETIDSLFDNYFSLEPRIAKIADIAASYVVSAVELRNSRKTLSLLAAFTALETMVNLEFKDHKPETCSECSQKKFSIAKKFREYLLKYIGESDANKKKFNSYYSVRSKIVHTGEQLKTELLFADVSKEDQHKEFTTSIEILQLSKLSIINWLLKR